MNIKQFSSRLLAPLLILTLSASLSGCKKEEAAAPQDVKNVKVAAAKIATISNNIEYSSKLKPGKEVSISSKLAGKVATVNTDVGHAVKEGDLLFTLDAKDLQVQMNQQKAGTEFYKASLMKTKDSTYDQQLLTYEQAIARAQTTYDDASDNYNKQQKLFEAGAIAKQTLTDAETRFKNATNDLNSANENLRVFKEKASPQSVDMASAQLEQAEASLANTALQLDNSKIYSPISGTVSVSNVEAGELISSNISAMTIIDSSTLIAEIGVPDTAIGKLKKGQKVELKVSSLAKAIEGKINSISPNIDEKTLIYPVKIEVDNSQGLLTPGMFTRVLLPSDARENVVTIPNESIKIENGIKYIYIVEGDTIRKKVIKTGLSDEKVTEILENIKQDDLIVLEGQNFLKDGDKVNAIK
jgi:HlyD family secretion protein